MRVHIRHIVFLLIFPLVTWGQSSLPADTLPKRDSAKIVQILKADKLRVIDKDSNKLNMFVGHVLIRQGNTLIECDSVVQNALLNMVEAFGNVVNIGDFVTLDSGALAGQKAEVLGFKNKHEVRLKIESLGFELVAYINQSQ